LEKRGRYIKNAKCMGISPKEAKIYGKSTSFFILLVLSFYL